MVKLYILIFISCFVVSCNYKVDNFNEPHKKISLENTKSTVLKDVISKIEVIELSHKEKAYIPGYKRLSIKDNLFLFEDKKGTLYLFGKNGEYISNSEDKIGNGKGEYSIILASTYNKYSKEIEVVTPTGILKYDINFNYKGSSLFADKETKGMMFNYIYDINEHEHLMLSPLDREKGESFVYIYDSNKSKITNKIVYDAECPYITMQEECVSDSNFIALPCMNYSFSQINLKDYALKHSFTFDFGDTNLHRSDYMNKGDTHAIMEYLAVGCEKSLPLRTFKSNNKVVSMVKTGALRSNFKTFFVDLETSESKYIPYDNGNVKIPLFEAFIDDVLYACVPEDELMQYVDESLIDERTQKIIKSHNEESNYYILKYYLK